jgi:hypothetical protein
MRYQPGSAITGAIKLKTTTKLQPVIEEAPEPPEVQSAVRQPCQPRFIAAPAACGRPEQRLNFRQRKPVDFLDIGGEDV